MKGGPLAVALAGWLIAAGWCGWTHPEPASLLAASAWVAERHPQVHQVSASAFAEHDHPTRIVVDVRPEAEFSVSHLAHAWRSSDPQAIIAEARRRGCTEIIVYCSIGARSSALAERIVSLAPELQVSNLAGGIFTWATAARPLFDAAGKPTTLVHPYDEAWGRLLAPSLRASLAP